jgi:hypothetical protein
MTLALTLHRPWARYVATGQKRIENRPWAPPAKMLGETIAIHAGKKWDPDAANFIGEVLGTKPSLWPAADSLRLYPEGIIGTAKIVTWFALSKGEDPRAAIGRRLIGRELESRMFGNDLSPAPDWAVLTELDRQFSFGSCCWVLREARMLANPIPCRGFQKLWNIPAKEQALLEAALVEHDKRCCERDLDGDGNCDRHPGLLR